MNCVHCGIEFDSGPRKDPRRRFCGERCSQRYWYLIYRDRNKEENRADRAPEAKLCECGCGQLAPIASQTQAKWGHIQGQPMRFVKGHHRRVHKTLEQAFLAHFKPGEPGICWLWQGQLSVAGYGRVSFGAGERMLAHRASIIIHYGPIADKYNVCHSCDNPPCVNPAHLFQGSHADNMQDAVAKGRMNRGEKSAGAILDEPAITEIRRLRRDEGWLQSEIASKFGIRPSHVSLIVNYKIWKHVP